MNKTVRLNLNDFDGICIATRDKEGYEKSHITQGDVFGFEVNYSHYLVFSLGKDSQSLEVDIIKRDDFIKYYSILDVSLYCREKAIKWIQEDLDKMESDLLGSLGNGIDVGDYDFSDFEDDEILGFNLETGAPITVKDAKEDFTKAFGFPIEEIGSVVLEEISEEEEKYYLELYEAQVKREKESKSKQGTGFEDVIKEEETKITDEELLKRGLQNAIDRAIDEGDIDLFNSLIKKYKKLEQQ